MAGPYHSADLYDLIYSTKNYQQEAEVVHRLIRAHKTTSGNRLLDLACGSGEHLKYLQSHYQVQGLDISEDFVGIARAKVPGAVIHVADMTSFDLKDEFDAVICLFSSIAYANTRDQFAATIGNMSRHLRSGGVLILEPWFTPSTFLAGHFSAAHYNSVDRKVVRMHHWSEKNGMAVADAQILDCSTSGIRYIRETHELGLFTREEHEQTLRDYGLTPLFESDGFDERGLFIGIKT